METKREELKELKEAHDSLKKKVQKIREASVELTSQIEDESKAHDDFKKKITFWTGKMNTLTLQDLKAFGEPEDTLPKLTEEELNSIDKEKLQSSIVILEGILLIQFIYLFLNHKNNNSFFLFSSIAKLKEAKPNLSVIDQYMQLEKDYLQKAGDLDVVTKERDLAKNEFDNLRKRRLEEFMEGFTEITQKLKEMYQVIIFYLFSSFLFLFQFFFKDQF